MGSSSPQYFEHFTTEYMSPPVIFSLKEQDIAEQDGRTNFEKKPIKFSLNKVSIFEHRIIVPILIGKQSFQSIFL